MLVRWIESTKVNGTWKDRQKQAELPRAEAVKKAIEVWRGEQPDGETFTSLLSLEDFAPADQALIEAS